MVPPGPENTRFHSRGSSKIKVFVFGQRTAKQTPQRPPKSTPKRLPESQKVAQKRCWISGSILAPILSILGSQKASQEAPKITQNSPSAPQGRPEASRDPPEGLQGVILASFWAPGSSFSSLSSVLFEACARLTTRSTTLFEITSQRILCDRCGTDAHKTEGSVAGLGPQAHWRSGH